MYERRVISIIILNEASSLSRVVGLFAGRGYNIESLTVAPIPDCEYSRINITTFGDSRVIEQIIKQLHKIITVLKVIEKDDLIKEEMVLAKFEYNQNISNIESIIRTFNGKILEVNENNIITIVTDEQKRIEKFLGAIKKFTPKEIVRSGVVALER